MISDLFITIYRHSSLVKRIGEGCIHVIDKGSQMLVTLSSTTSGPHGNGNFSIIVDGSFKPISSLAAIALIIINDQGMCLLRRAQKVNATSAFQAEVLACLEAISVAVHSGLTYITILTDCLLLIQCLGNRKLVSFCLSHVFLDIRVWIVDF